MISVMIALLAAGAGFIGMTNCMELNKEFWVLTVIFVIASEYLFLFMYANEAFIDEHIRTYYEEKIEDDYFE